MPSRPHSDASHAGPDPADTSPKPPSQRGSGAGNSPGATAGSPTAGNHYQPNLFGFDGEVAGVDADAAGPSGGSSEPADAASEGAAAPLADRTRETPAAASTRSCPSQPSAKPESVPAELAISPAPDHAPSAASASTGGLTEMGVPGPLAGARVVLVDAHSLIYQLFHALPPMTSPQGWPVSTVHGFVGDLLELINRMSPKYLICAFDHSDKTFRNDLYDQYKAHRESMPDELRQQIPLIREAVAALGVGIMEAPGFEADDILATVAKLVERGGGECVVVTSDKDCRQLITDRVKLYNIRKGQEMTAAELLEDWGVRPDQVVDFQALVGDPVDNVPGIPLIGPKLAQQLLEEFGTLEGILDNVDKVSGAKRKENLMAGREKALLSRVLVKLRDDVPCDPPWEASRMRADLDHLQAMFDRFGFRRLKSRVAEIYGRDNHAEATSAQASAAPPTRPSAQYQTITDEESLARLVATLRDCREIAIDTETTGTSPRGCELVGISIAWQPGSAAYIPVLAPEGEPKLERDVVITALRPILEDPSIAKLGHNLKFDIIVLRSAGVEVRGELNDTMVADYLLNPGGRNHTLDDLSTRYLQHKMTSIKSLIGSGKSEITMDRVPLEAISAYACDDVDVPLQIMPGLIEPLETLGLMKLYRELEMPLIEVLAEMEFNGIRVDSGHLERMSGLFATRIATLREEIYEAAGSEFNLDSPKQLANVLFNQLGLPVVKKTKTGPSTDVEVLETLAAQHPLPKRLIEYRQATKLKNTYIDALPRLINPKTGRVHTSYRQDVAATGRLSSTDPNLQNIPIRTEEGRAIRGAFRAGPEDWLLLAADYSQIELRVLAHFSGDPTLVEAYEQDRDIHTLVAAEVHGVPESAVTSDMRRVAKTINFGIVYGQSPFGLARTLGISKEEAAIYIELYFQRYPGVQDFMLQTLTDCRRNGFVQTILGRRRDVQSIRDLSQMEPAKRRNLTETERIAINTVIQGSAADLIKQAMITLYRRLAESDLRAKLLLQIHDELLWEVHPEDAQRLSDLVRHEMISVMDLRVPLKVEVGFGKTWADLK